MSISTVRASEILKKLTIHLHVMYLAHYFNAFHSAPFVT